jgi:hypothetical protein
MAFSRILFQKNRIRTPRPHIAASPHFPGTGHSCQPSFATQGLQQPPPAGANFI